MTLESLLGPVQWADKQIVRQHAKVAQAVERRYDIDRADLAFIMSAGGVLAAGAYALTYVGTHTTEPNAVYTTMPFLAGSVYLSQAVGNILNVIALHVKGDKEETSEAIAVSPAAYYARKTFRALRLPMFAAGLSGIVGSLYEQLALGPSSDNSQFLFAAGVTTLFASALYMRDADPKLLDKAPFWKKAYSWAKEKLSLLTPEPVLQPVPIQSYTANPTLLP